MSNVNITGDAYTTVVAGENVHKVTILRLYGEDGVVISHYPAIGSPLIPEDYVVPEERVQEEVEKAVNAIVRHYKEQGVEATAYQGDGPQ
jgi:hypothetical protein